MQPLASVTVTLYVVLTVGVTVNVLLPPEIGVHEYDDSAAGAVRTMEAPSGMLPVEEV